MKKIFTLMASALVASAAWAQVPELLFQGQPIVAGETYQTGYTVEEIPIGPITLRNYTQDSYLTLKGILGEDVTIEVNATPEVQVCGLDNKCEVSSSVIRTGTIGSYYMISDDGEMAVVDLKIDLVTPDNGLGTDPATLLHDITVKVKAYYNFNPSEYTETTVVLTKKPESEIGGVADVKDQPTISLGAANTLNYNVNAPTRLEIHSINGVAVLSRTINQSGSISLDMLPSGVYVYSAGAAHGKILVK